jgi:hypothetical protein
MDRTGDEVFLTQSTQRKSTEDTERFRKIGSTAAGFSLPLFFWEKGFFDGRSDGAADACFQGGDIFLG